MTLAKRIVRRLIRMLRPPKATPNAETAASKGPPTTKESPPQEQLSSVSQNAAVAAPNPDTRSSSDVTASPPASAETVSEPSKQNAADEKVAKHRLRATKGLLKFVLKNGGNCSLADLHNHSETRYFIGHKAFSDLMEDLIAEELLSYDHATSIATLTENGQALIAT